MATSVTSEQVAHIARLARLRFSPDELDGFTSQFNQILEYMEQLSLIDVTGVEPLAFVHAASNVLRDDEPGPMVSPADALSNAPRKTEGFFSVPKVLE
jgi:aspartyl-tRNA(Asn)/glutamyl-tRNA(Gln) amidotransferase subunit C